jgi:S-adenosylmethionine-dependent methyltransferase
VTAFSAGEDAWVALLGRLRDVVRQELVARQLAEVVAGQRTRVLDLGCGQGTQALRLARAGHDVVGLDASAAMLDRFSRTLDAEPEEVRRRVTLVHGPGAEAPVLLDGRFDLVLCHGVLMYETADAPLLEAACAVLASGGVLSLLVRNGEALALRPALLRDWSGASAAVGSERYVNRLGVEARAHRLEQLDAELARLGLARRAHFGVRVATDHLDEAAPEGQELQALLDAEEALGRQDPYRQIAALLHVLYA